MFLLNLRGMTRLDKCNAYTQQFIFRWLCELSKDERMEFIACPVKAVEVEAVEMPATMGGLPIF